MIGKIISLQKENKTASLLKICQFYPLIYKGSQTPLNIFNRKVKFG